MGLVYSTGSFIAKSLPLLLAKLGSVLLFVLAIGMFMGYWFASAGYSNIVLLIPIAAIVVMWRKLDEGAIVFIALIAIALLFPGIF